MDQPQSLRPPREAVRCPTCRLTQEWSDQCRRCKSDLRLLRETAETTRRARERCLLALHAGRHREAERLANRYHELRPSADSRRLLALCALLGGDWADAVALAQHLPEEP
jgi:hypothetical protein